VIGSSSSSGSTTGVLFVSVSVVAMLLVRRIVLDRERRLQLAERERSLAAREAVLEERARIARELHDAVAHDVSIMVVQAGAERRALEGPAAASLESIEELGRGALVEMRRLLGMLRGEDAEAVEVSSGG
jgi:signal transduction histidine kinase